MCGRIVRDRLKVSINYRFIKEWAGRRFPPRPLKSCAEIMRQCGIATVAEYGSGGALPTERRNTYYILWLKRTRQLSD